MKPTELLEEIDRLDQQATPGPWHVAPEEDEDGSKFPWAIFVPKNDLWGPQGWDHEHYIQEIPELTIPDAEFIALARTALPVMSKALRAVLEVHQKTEHQRAYGFPRADKWEHYCIEDDQTWPCPTMQAIVVAMEG